MHETRKRDTVTRPPVGIPGLAGLRAGVSEEEPLLLLELELEEELDSVAFGDCCRLVGLIGASFGGLQ